MLFPGFLLKLVGGTFNIPDMSPNITFASLKNKQKETKQNNIEARKI